MKIPIAIEHGIDLRLSRSLKKMTEKAGLFERLQIIKPVRRNVCASEEWH